MELETKDEFVVVVVRNFDEIVERLGNYAISLRKKEREKEVKKRRKRKEEEKIKKNVQKEKSFGLLKYLFDEALSLLFVWAIFC